MRGEDDSQSVDRVLRGDRRAFEALVRRHERRVFRVAVAILGNAEDAEETMQDTFLKAFRHLGSVPKRCALHDLAHPHRRECRD